MKVLIVEDDKKLAQMYQDGFELAKHDVTSADGAQDALNKLDKQDVDIILLDMLLPGRSGVEILHELSSYVDWQDIPVILMSDMARDEIKISDEHLAKYGIKTIIHKSATTPTELVELAEEVTSGEKV